MGALVVTGTVVVAFCALLSLYVNYRQRTLAAGDVWFPSGTIEMGPPGMMLVTLVMSVVSLQWAVQAARAEDRPHGFIALGMTIFLGLAVINQFWFVYQDTNLAIDDSTASLMFYAVTGTFIAMLIAAIISVAVTGIRSLLGTFGDELGNIIWASSIFWNATAFCYALVWYVVFVTK